MNGAVKGQSLMTSLSIRIVFEIGGIRCYHHSPSGGAPCEESCLNLINLSWVLVAAGEHELCNGQLPLQTVPMQHKLL